MKRLVAPFLAAAIGLPVPVSADVTNNGQPLSLPTLDVAQAADGRAWSTATGNVSVQSGQVLEAVLINPTGSGCATAVFTLRRYGNTSTAALGFTSYSNPAAITANTSTVGNRLVGASPATGMSFGYATRATGSMGGTAGVTASIMPSAYEEITVPLALPAGKSWGVQISGLTGGVLQSTVTVGVTLAGYCIP